MDFIKNLPDIDLLKMTAKSLAVLDCIIMPDLEYRYFSYNSAWDNNEEMASIRDGEGSECFLLFSDLGVAGKLLEKGSLAENGETQLELVPDLFSSFKNEVAFSLAETTFYFWKLNNRSYWEASAENRKFDFLKFYTDGPIYYHAWAEGYYERSVNLLSIEYIFLLQPITDELLLKLSSDIQLADIIDDLTEIGYPYLQ